MASTPVVAASSASSTSASSASPPSSASTQLTATTQFPFGDGFATRRPIAAGDIVIMFERFNVMTALTMTPGSVFQNRFGVFHHDDLIGKPFGCKVHSRRLGGGHMYGLAPTAELWSQALCTRTQIVFSSDAAVIAMQLHLRAGSRMAEAGTGSGALSTAFARIVGPTGHLFTFEFNENRAQLAQEEFAKNHLDHVVTAAWGDICKDGCGAALEGTLDAIMLDLPNPWDAIPHAAAALRPGGRLCSFSPCIEQVQKSCVQLSERGFISTCSWVRGGRVGWHRRGGTGNCWECVTRDGDGGRGERVVEEGEHH